MKIFQNLKLLMVMLALPLTFATLSFAEPYAFPVPYVANRAAQPSIFFKNLPGPGHIKIFNIVGEEVVRLDIPPGQALMNWNIKNKDGKSVTSGVYLYRIDAAGRIKTGKIVIIR